MRKQSHCGKERFCVQAMHSTFPLACDLCAWLVNLFRLLVYDGSASYGLLYDLLL
jgi:hypothetical protein